MAVPSIFHVGFPKTGSSTLQAYLKEDSRIQMLYKPGFFGTDRWYKGDYPFLDPGRISIETDEAIMRQASIGRRTDLRTVFGRIRKLCPDARIVLFLREQKNILISEYKHHIRFTFDAYDFGAYLNSSIGHSFRSIITYHQVMEDILEYFPKNQIFVYLFEEMKADPSGFFQRLYHELFDLSPPSVKFGKKANIGIPFSIAKLKRKLNRKKIFREGRWVGHIDRFFLMQLYNSLYFLWPKKGDDDEFIKECSYFDKIMDEYAESNARLLEMIDLPLEKYGYRVDKSQIQGYQDYPG